MPAIGSRTIQTTFTTELQLKQHCFSHNAASLTKTIKDKKYIVFFLLRTTVAGHFSVPAHAIITQNVTLHKEKSMIWKQLDINKYAALWLRHSLFNAYSNAHLRTN